MSGGTVAVPRTGRARPAFHLAHRVELAMQALAYLALSLPLGVLAALVLASRYMVDQTALYGRV